MSASNQRGLVRQPEVGSVLREHAQRLRALEALPNSNAYGDFYNWIALDYLAITSGGTPPDIDSFDGQYVLIPAPGIDNDATGLGVVQFRFTLGAINSPTGPWNLYLPESAVNLTRGPVFGDGRLVHTDGSGAVIAYHVEYGTTEGTAVGIQMTVQGAEPDPGSIPSGYDPGYIRATYPCVIADGDYFEGWISGQTASSVD